MDNTISTSTFDITNSDFGPFLYPSSGNKFLHLRVPNVEYLELKAMQGTTVARSRPVFMLRDKSDDRSSKSTASTEQRKLKLQPHGDDAHAKNNGASSIRPYECEVCGKAFSQYGYLVVHRRAHTGERPYACTYCSKRFTQSGNLTVHKRTHMFKTKTVNFCQKCNKFFLRVSNFNKHLSIHFKFDPPASE